MLQLTDQELAIRSDVELAVLFHMVSQSLGNTCPGSRDRQAVIANLQNINKARATRHKLNMVPGF